MMGWRGRRFEALAEKVNPPPAAAGDGVPSSALWKKGAAHKSDDPFEPLYRFDRG